jgi:2-amino-4-hydroxy-6-hydroxymethyldihydropteridine diphosphokinase
MAPAARALFYSFAACAQERNDRMIVIALGANLDSAVGPPAATLAAALRRLRAEGVAITAVSRFYRTPAWPNRADPPFVNAVAAVATSLEPKLLMELLHAIETAYGRTRGVKNAPRSLDLDLIDYAGRVEDGPPILPHPRLSERAFVLVPLADIAPNWRHPVTGRSLAELIGSLPGDAVAEVRPVSS